LVVVARGDAGWVLVAVVAVGGRVWVVVNEREEEAKGVSA
jgi:hypothetical protein